MVITKRQTNLIKGISIFCILAHNFFHFIQPNTGENEFYFERNHIIEYINYMMVQPFEFINLFFSYFGHYGVQLFIFLSGYGFAKSYDEKSKISVFFEKRIKYIYSSLIVAIIFYLTYQISFNKINFGCDSIFSLIYRVTFLSNFIPHEALKLNGPWWFYGVIVQLYLLFPFLFKVAKRIKLKVNYLLIFILIFGNSILQHYINKYELNIYYIFIGHLPIFYFGILSSFERSKLNKKVILTSIFVFLLGNYYQLLFPFSFITITIIGVHFLLKINIDKYKSLSISLQWLGSKSLYLFAVNGFLRTPLLSSFDRETASSKIILFILFFILCIIVSLMCEWMTKKIVSIYHFIKMKTTYQQRIIIVSYNILFLLYIVIFQKCPALLTTIKVLLPCLIISNVFSIFSFIISKNKVIGSLIYLLSFVLVFVYL